MSTTMKVLIGVVVGLVVASVAGGVYVYYDVVKICKEAIEEVYSMSDDTFEGVEDMTNAFKETVIKKLKENGYEFIAKKVGENNTIFQGVI